MTKTNFEGMVECAKQASMSHMPEPIKCVYKHILSHSNFDGVEDPEAIAIAYHCLSVGMLHGLYAGLSQALQIQDGSDLARKQEIIDMLRDDVAKSLDAIAKESQPRKRTSLAEIINDLFVRRDSKNG